MLPKKFRIRIRQIEVDPDTATATLGLLCERYVKKNHELELSQCQRQTRKLGSFISLGPDNS